MKVHLVDGTYELFRNHFGAPPRADRRGRAVGATCGLVRTLVSLLNEPDTTHVACAFDHVIESFRNDLFDGYKTGKDLEEDLRAQFPLAERAAAALGLVVWPMVDFEADDAIATAAARFADEPAVDQVVICSPDKDFAQCVHGRRVVCLDRRRQTLLDESGVAEKFGVPPSSIPDWLALVGDAADGIPGLPGFGAKTTAALLTRFGHLESLPADAAAWGVRGASRLAETLAAHRADATLYRRLATLRTDVPLGETLDDLRWRGAPREELDALCRELDAPDLAARLRTGP